ncbi:penicillin-binding protein 2 [Sphingosinicella sp. BN140058]|uniref:peptidoglycan D,D-transpeptidase FtsI family protein n=1 Tax=Sphingosinicella sp. BN140058 TaxID=1892855 RepID=UPI00101123A7|nr:penicillin-binding protein 2 [Sphingosinicella sp. BN140058]QAY77759.1 penicillin-binding protein 2 [Sphingosinicella sp. BN140058]
MATLAAEVAKFKGAPDRPQGLAITYQRLMLVMLVFAGVTLMIVGRLLFLQVFTDRAGSAQIANPLVPPRADIVDRNGLPLARTIDAWSIAIHPNRLISNPSDLAQKLAELMPEKTAAEYKALLTSGKSFVYLSRRAVPELVAAVNALGEPAIAFDREPERLYPQTAMAGHVLGWTDMEGHGVTGMEKVLEGRLTDPATRADPVALSIDSRVQAAMESELGAAVAKHSAEGGTGIVLDVRTGEVVAMASMPTFNPNAAGRSDPNALFNRATMGVYELGSTFKPITVAAAIDAGVIKSVTQRYPSGAPIQIGRFRIKDDHPIAGSANIVETLVHSSNIVTAQIADQMGVQRMQAAFRALGFHEPAYIEIDKARPLFPREWSRATVLTSGFGHGVAVSPLHLASAYAALVNGGIWRPATLMKVSKPSAGRRVYAESTSLTMRKLLRMIVLTGTGRKGDAPGYRVGGKTGTAEKTASGGYSRKVNISTFAAVFPMDNPRYVVIAMLDAPKATADTYGFTTAAWTAAPVVSKVISRTAPLLGIVPDDSHDLDVSDMMAMVAKKEK